VCENPRVLEAAVDRGSTCAAVCTQGQPAVVVLALVRTLAELGATLRYHGDFDWPGLTIANAMVGAHGCRPWRMSVDDIEAVPPRLLASGRVPDGFERPGLRATITPGSDNAATVQLPGHGCGDERKSR
jgi:uncharacterized protein (TIGR02679 family)